MYVSAWHVVRPSVIMGGDDENGDGCDDYDDNDVAKGKTEKALLHQILLKHVVWRSKED